MKRLKAFITILFIVIVSNCFSQETIHTELDYTFLHKLIDTAKANYPKSKTFDRKTTIAINNLKKAQLSWFDVLSFSFIYSPGNSTSLVNPILSGYQAGLFVNIGALVTKPYQIKQAREELEISKLDKSEYLITLETMVKQRYFAYIQQLVILRSRAATIIDLETVVKQTRYRFEKAELGFDDYNKSVATLAEAKVKKIEAETAVLVAKASLEELVGKKLEDIK